MAGEDDPAATAPSGRRLALSALIAVVLTTPVFLNVLAPGDVPYFFLDHEGTDVRVEGGWSTRSGGNVLVRPGPCNIPVIGRENISGEQFLENFAFRTPVVVDFGTSYNERFRKLCERDNLLAKWGSTIVKLSSSNTYSYDTKDVTLSDYAASIAEGRPHDPRTPANETFYFFGYNDVDGEWKELFDAYRLPDYDIPGHRHALSFGVAGPGTGVPFHFHGPGFAESVHGRKRWFLTPHHVVPEFNPNKTTLLWYLEDYARLSRDVDFFECTVSPGQAIYFPDKWWHATLNVDTAVFISTFLSP